MNTMNRCATLVVAALAFAGTADAQVTPRPFPATALRGELMVVQPPDVLLNGRPARLAPGARIRAENNLLQLSGALVNQRLSVNYTLDTNGLMLDVWILNAEERARRPWPTTPEQAAAWSFDVSAQTWSRP
jgi:glycine/D-amino acid oxidase-like deaminating enzyme